MERRNVIGRGMAFTYSQEEFGTTRAASQERILGEKMHDGTRGGEKYLLKIREEGILQECGCH